MKLKYLADENIPRLVVSFLQKKKIRIDSCSTIKKGMTDKEILAYAHQNNMIIITFDKDFGQLVFKEKFQPLNKFSVVHEKHIRIVSLPSEEK